MTNACSRAPSAAVRAQRALCPSVNGEPRNQGGGLISIKRRTADCRQQLKRSARATEQAVSPHTCGAHAHIAFTPPGDRRVLRKAIVVCFAC